MKKLISATVLLFVLSRGYNQTNMQVTSVEVANILRGSYIASNYQASAAITNPDIISSELLSRISTDSLKSYLFALKSFRTRNSGSDTVSATQGIGAARRWAYNKFVQFSNANEGRLRPAYFQFDYTMCSVLRHRNIIATLPGSQTVDKSVILIEAHIDSRCESLCNIGCNAFGIEDNATGTALVLELARILSKYTFKHTIVFSLNTAEEQGTMGAQAFADYMDNNNINIKTVSNNDVSGGVFCGYTASAPGCPFYSHIDSTGLRIFSYGGFNSHHKQWARYVKLQYKEQLISSVSVPMNIRIMTNEDRIGRGGDHQPFREKGYTSVRFTAANENGDANIIAGYKDRQHSSRDSLGIDTDSDGIEDSLYINLNYLSRNTLINGNAIAMAALSPDTITLVSTIVSSSNRVRVQFNSAITHPAYRVAIRSVSNDWDSVYTVTGKTVDTIVLPYGTNTSFFISAASVDDYNTESLFSTEYALTTGMILLTLNKTTSSKPATIQENYGIELMQNKPNPFDESTRISIKSGSDIFADRTWIQITDFNGRTIKRIKVYLKKGINEVNFDHGFNYSGNYIYSLIIDGMIVESKQMLFKGR